MGVRSHRRLIVIGEWETSPGTPVPDALDQRWSKHSPPDQIVQQHKKARRVSASTGHAPRPEGLHGPSIIGFCGRSANWLGTNTGFCLGSARDAPAARPSVRCVTCPTQHRAGSPPQHRHKSGNPDPGSDQANADSSVAAPQHAGSSVAAQHEAGPQQDCPCPTQHDPDPFRQSEAHRPIAHPKRGCSRIAEMAKRPRTMYSIALWPPSGSRCAPRSAAAAGPRNARRA